MTCQTLDEANTVLAQCRYPHTWAQTVSWQARKWDEHGTHAIWICYRFHPDTGSEKVFESFEVESALLGKTGLFKFPIQEPELVNIAFEILMYVELHEIGERFSYQEAKIFHPHATLSGVWCKDRTSPTWKHWRNEIDPREPEGFELKKRLEAWQRFYRTR